MRREQPSGFVLLEVLLAIALFGMAGLGLVRALNQTAVTAGEAQMELRMLMKLQSALTEASKMKEMEELDIISDPDAYGVYVETVVREMEEELETEEGQPLTNMWHIRVRAFWEDARGKGEVVAETWRYAPLYQQ